MVRPDVALLHCSPPDAHGFCTLGTSVDWARGAAEHSKAERRVLEVEGLELVADIWGQHPI